MKSKEWKKLWEIWEEATPYGLEELKVWAKVGKELTKLLIFVPGISNSWHYTHWELGRIVKCAFWDIKYGGHCWCCLTPIHKCDCCEGGR